mmetsp:Transcript_29857/g.100562  ORF Transcript_29857/g.100562 Transcript_29857/m.100562 type:complete len:275 (+) Transcript_29857:233-1057(+)
MTRVPLGGAETEGNRPMLRISRLASWTASSNSSKASSAKPAGGSASCENVLRLFGSKNAYLGVPLLHFWPRRRTAYFFSVCSMALFRVALPLMFEGSVTIAGQPWRTATTLPKRPRQPVSVWEHTPYSAGVFMHATGTALSKSPSSNEMAYTPGEETAETWPRKYSLLRCILGKPGCRYFAQTASPTAKTVAGFFAPACAASACGGGEETSRARLPPPSSSDASRARLLRESWLSSSASSSAKAAKAFAADRSPVGDARQLAGRSSRVWGARAS